MSELSMIKEYLDKDYLDRNSKLNTIIERVSLSNSNKIFCLDGYWGSGKTIFVKQMEYLIKNIEEYCKYFPESPDEILDSIKGTSVFYYNAWENDMLDAPVISLIFQLAKTFKQDIQTEITIRKKLVTLSGLLLKIATSGVLEKNDFKLTEENIFDSITSADNIKKQFNELINCILEERYNKLIILIDELDRCKPSFAVRLLESVKHFYDNDKVVFVFSTNTEQLAYTIKKFYGEAFDGVLYLQRFFNNIFTLKSTNEEIKKYLSKKYSVVVNRIDIINEVINACINYFDFTLRECDQFVENYKEFQALLYRRYSGKDDLFLHYIQVFSIILFSLKAKDLSEYRKFMHGNWNDFEKLLNNNIQILKNDNWFHDYLEIEVGKDLYIALNEAYTCLFSSLMLSCRLEQQNMFNYCQLQEMKDISILF